MSPTDAAPAQGGARPDSPPLPPDDRLRPEPRPLPRCRGSRLVSSGARRHRPTGQLHAPEATSHRRNSVAPRARSVHRCRRDLRHRCGDLSDGLVAPPEVLASRRPNTREVRPPARRRRVSSNVVLSASQTMTGRDSTRSATRRTLSRPSPRIFRLLKFSDAVVLKRTATTYSPPGGWANSAASPMPPHPTT